MAVKAGDSGFSMNGVRHHRTGRNQAVLGVGGSGNPVTGYLFTSVRPASDAPIQRAVGDERGLRRDERAGGRIDGAEVRRAGPYVYFAGKKIWDGAGMVEDRLGSKLETSGTSAASYYPFGELKSGTASQFATYLRNGTTGLDYAQQRWYSSQVMRFTNPDPWGGSASIASPQSWNRYGYVQGDPVNPGDPSGLGGMFVWNIPAACPAGMHPEGAVCINDWQLFGWTYYPPPYWVQVIVQSRGGGDRTPYNKGGWYTDPVGAAKTGWQYLKSIWKDCLGQFSAGRGFSADELQTLLTADSSAGGAAWWDTRKSDVGSRTVDSIAHNGDPTSLRAFVGSANAMVVRSTRNVVLGINWYTDLTQTDQIATTIHESLHILLDIGDADLRGWLLEANTTFVATDKYGSGDITGWIAGGCK